MYPKGRPLFAKWTAYAWLIFCPSGCLGFADQGDPRISDAGRDLGIVLTEVATGGYHGLSDLTVAHGPDGAPALWAMPEQQRALVRINTTHLDHPYLATPQRPVEGIDARFDTESVTALSGGRFAIGTETTTAGRPEEVIFVVGPKDHDPNSQGPLVVQDTVLFPYALWPGVVARTNEGLEGLCAAGDTWLATSETVATDSHGARYAPLGHYNTRTHVWTGYALQLTLPTGRISAVQCRIHPARPDAIELIAIERHYGVGHILHAWIPINPTQPTNEPVPIVPTVLVDLAALMMPLVNFEGLVWGPHDDLMLLTDNHMGFVRGPTHLLVVRP